MINNATQSISIQSAHTFTETDLRELIKKIQTLQEDIRLNPSVTAAGDGGRKSLFDKLLNGLGQIEGRLSQLGIFEEEFRNSVDSRVSAIHKLLRNIEKADSMEEEQEEGENATSTEEEVENQLRLMNKEIRKLKHQIPARGAAVEGGPAVAGARPGEALPEAETAVKGLLAARGSEGFGNSELFREVREACEGLGEREKKCLLCVSVLAENEEVKKRMVAYWWAGEGLLDEKRDIREAAGEILDRLVGLELIRPVKRKRWPEVKRFRMEPIVRAALARIAKEEAFVRFTGDGRFAAVFCGRADKDSAWKPAEKLETVFNVEEQFPDLMLKKLAKIDGVEAHDLLLKMKALKVLYLGNWRSSGTFKTEFRRQASHRSGRDRVLERVEEHEKAKASKPSRRIKNKRADRVHKMADRSGNLGPEVMPQPGSASERNIISEEADPLGHLELLPHRPHASRPFLADEPESPEGLRGRKLSHREVLHPREPRSHEVPQEAQRRREQEGFSDQERASSPLGAHSSRQAHALLGSRVFVIAGRDEEHRRPTVESPSQSDETRSSVLPLFGSSEVAEPIDVGEAEEAVHQRREARREPPRSLGR